MKRKDLALKIAGVLDEKKAADITIYDIADRSGFADYLVICTGNNLRQIGAMADELEDKLAEDEILPRGIEGKNDSGWILLDYGDIIINLFTPEMRNHYNIDRLWSDCIKLDFNCED